MAKRKEASSLIRRFAGCQKGTSAVMFALSVVPLLLAGGAAIDYLRYTEANTQLQAALDSGALAVAAANNLSMKDRIAAGEDTFNRNMAASGIDADDIDVRFKVNGKEVSASAGFKLRSGFMQLAGISGLDVAAETEINIPESKKAEVVLVLDYSGSMAEISGGQVKYVAMKNAAKKLITELVATNDKRVKVGLVPFSHHVYVTLPKKFVVGQTGTGDWTGCTQDRKYPHNLTADAPGIDAASKWGQAQAAVHASDGCADYAPNHLVVKPLTTDYDALRDQLDAMKPYAWTHIALGAEFGFHLLSPDEPFAQGAPYTDAKTNKFMVILTDGRQTEPAFGPGERRVRRGETNLEAICENAKSAGITVLTVAFDLQDDDTKNRLSDCSSDPATDFLVAENSADIATAFGEIQKQIVSEMYISK